MEQEELSILKRQNVSRSLSFDLMAGEDMRQVQENGLTENLCGMAIEKDDNSFKNETKGTVRMSKKQVYCMFLSNFTNKLKNLILLIYQL